MFKRAKLSESEWLLSVLILIWASHLLSFWAHSLVFLFPFLGYILIFKLKSYRAIFLFSFSSAIFFLWNFGSNYLVDKLKISNFLLESVYFLKPKLSKIISDNYSSYDLNNSYGRECAQFVSFLLFNQREGLEIESKSILKEIANLSISHLLIVSGLHLNILKKGISQIVRIIPCKSLRKILILLSLFSYVWATGFSLPSSRVLFEELGSLNNSKARDKEEIYSLKSLESKREVCPLIKWSRAAWLSFFFFPNSVSSASFLLSYFFSLSFRVIDKWGEKTQWTKLQKTLLKIGFASLFSILLFSYKTKKILILAPLNQLLFGPIIIPLFIFYFVSWPFNFLCGAGLKFYSYFNYLISLLKLNKSYIPREGGSPLEVLYACFILSLAILLLAFWRLKSSPEIKVIEEEVYRETRESKFFKYSKKINSEVPAIENIQSCCNSNKVIENKDKSFKLKKK